MRELAPLLAEDGIDLNNVGDMGALNRALQKATERRNLELFTPVGARRDQAIALLILVVAAIANNETELAGRLLDSAQPESPGNIAADVSSCMGVALGLLDDWLSGQHPDVPKDVVDRVHLPTGHWFGERAAVNVLALARKGRAFGSLGSLITRQGSHQLLAGSALALAAVVLAWSRSSGTPIGKLLPAVIR